MTSMNYNKCTYWVWGNYERLAVFSCLNILLKRYAVIPINKVPIIIVVIANIFERILALYPRRVVIVMSGTMPPVVAKIYLTNDIEERPDA